MTTMLKVHPITAFDDNYIWCIHNDRHAYVVDPGDHHPVVEFLSEQRLTLAGIMITHHHADHIGGVRTLVDYSDRQQALPIWGPKTPRFPFVTHPVTEGDTLELQGVGLKCSVMEVPGHTLDHIAYISDLGLFCGDTLFSAGCGRLFEGNAQQMQNNFNRFRALPDGTAVYCSHEYTLANIAFAEHIWVDNNTLTLHQRWAEQQLAKGVPTLPSTIAIEKNINPFMNTHSDELRLALQQRLQRPITSDVDAFAALRELKDTF